MLAIESDKIFSPHSLFDVIVTISVHHNSSQLIFISKLGLILYSVTIRKTGPLVYSNLNKRPVRYNNNNMYRLACSFLHRFT